MYLEAHLKAKEEPDSIEINRSLLLETEQIFVVRDSVLDLIPVKPVYFSDNKVVLKDVPDGITILSKPVMGAYAGMLVKVFNGQVTNDQRLMRNIIAYFIKYHVAVNVIIVAFIIFGVVGALSLKSSYFPLTDSKNISYKCYLSRCFPTRSGGRYCS